VPDTPALVIVRTDIKMVGSADMSPAGLRPQAERPQAEETNFAVLDPAQAESYRVLRSRIDLSGLPPLTRAVTEAVLCETADFDYVTDLACDEAVLAAGIRAIAGGVPVVADAPAVAVGITGHPVICKAAEALAVRLARTTGITVPAAGVRLGFGEAGPGAVWVVGGAADALAEILRRVVEPALVIGMPAGFAGAAAVKDELRASGMPALSNVSEKGGPVVAAAAFTALLRAARGEPEP
jgi:precorrin-8X/cobalt-precorrin-8 methylmutase